MKEVTYARLNQELTALGFSIRVVTEDGLKLRVYEHRKTGVYLPLAYRPDDEAVLPHHLGAIQGTLKVYGIADPLDFAVRLQKAS